MASKVKLADLTGFKQRPPADLMSSSHLLVAGAGHSEKLGSLRHRPRNVVQTCFRAGERRCLAPIRWYCVPSRCVLSQSRACCTYYGSIAPRNESQAPRSAAEESRDRGAGMHKNGRVRMRPCEDRGKSQDKSGQSSWLSVNVKQSMRTQRADRQRGPSQQVTRGWWSYPETQEEGANH